MTDNALAVRTQGDVSAIMEQATVLVKSGYLPKSITSAQQAFAIMTMGRELGIDAWAALNGINVIQGKPTIAPQLMLALVNRSGELADMSITDDGDACSVTMTRKGRSPHTETFSMKDAAAMGLAGKDNWHKQAPTMRKWRAIAACCRVVFPDIIIGFYSPEEINPDIAIDYDTGAVEASSWQEEPVVSFDIPVNSGISIDNAGAAPTLPFLPDLNFLNFTKMDWASFWPFLAKHTGKKPSELHAWVHKKFKVESLTTLDMTFGEFLTAVDN